MHGWWKREEISFLEKKNNDISGGADVSDRLVLTAGLLAGQKKIYKFVVSKKTKMFSSDVKYDLKTWVSSQIDNQWTPYQLIETETLRSGATVSATAVNETAAEVAAKILAIVYAVKFQAYSEGGRKIADRFAKLDTFQYTGEIPTLENNLAFPYINIAQLDWFLLGNIDPKFKVIVRNSNGQLEIHIQSTQQLYKPIIGDALLDKNWGELYSFLWPIKK